MPVQEIALIVKYRTDGARRMPRIKDLGVLVEVPVMLSLVAFANRTRSRFA